MNNTDILTEALTDPLDHSNFMDAEIVDPDEAALDTLKDTAERVRREEKKQELGLTDRVYSLCKLYNNLTDEEEVQFLAFIAKHRRDILNKVL